MSQKSIDKANSEDYLHNYLLQVNKLVDNNTKGI